jgi:hypothetical protein
MDPDDRIELSFFNFRDRLMGISARLTGGEYQGAALLQPAPIGLK